MPGLGTRPGTDYCKFHPCLISRWLTLCANAFRFLGGWIRSRNWTCYWFVLISSAPVYCLYPWSTVFSHSTIHTTQRSIHPFLHNHNILSLQTSQVCYIQHCRYICEFPCRINERLLSYSAGNAGNHLFAKTLIVSIFFLIQILTKHNHFIHICRSTT